MIKKSVFSNSSASSVTNQLIDWWAVLKGKAAFGAYQTADLLRMYIKWRIFLTNLMSCSEAAFDCKFRPFKITVFLGSQASIQPQNPNLDQRLCEFDRRAYDKQKTSTPNSIHWVEPYWRPSEWKIEMLNCIHRVTCRRNLLSCGEKILAGPPFLMF